MLVKGATGLNLNRTDAYRIGLDDSLASNMRQAIIYTNDGNTNQILAWFWHIMTSFLWVTPDNCILQWNP